MNIVKFRKPRLTVEERKKVVAAYGEKKLTLKEISLKFGISIPTIYTILREYITHKI